MVEKLMLLDSSLVQKADEVLNSYDEELVSEINKELNGQRVVLEPLPQISQVRSWDIQRLF